MRLTLLAASGLLVLSAGALAACAPSAAESGARPVRQCFETSQVQNFRSQQGSTLYVRALHGVYELQTSGGCVDLDNAMRIALVPTPAGLGRACVGDWVDVRIASAGSGPSPCRARIARQLTEEEVEALPSRLRP